MYLIILILLIKFIANVSSSNYTPIEITTKLGKIIGKNEIINGKQLNVFLGVPYAVPPIKELRFKKPIPVKPWNSPLKAIDWPYVCYQSDNVTKHHNNRIASEDCLYLNIYSPKVDNKSPLPVMIWIHAGLFDYGFPNLIYTDPSQLSIRGNVIVVGVYYRLNTFGFLYGGNDDAPGNVGLYDQVLAFQWVKDNIESFGGDPKRVTIIGQSAGSVSVSLHILSPLSRDLFTNAIMMSTAGLTYRFGSDPRNAYNIWINGAKMVGCGNGKEFTSETIKCLRNLDAETLLRIPHFKQLKGRDEIANSIPYIVYGNEFLPQKPIQMLRNGNYKKGVSLLEGFNNNEGAEFAIKFDPKIFNSSSDITFKEANDAMNKIISKLPLQSSVNSDDIKKLYFTGISRNDSARLRRAMAAVIGDTQYVCGNNEFAKLIFSGDSVKSKVFQYQFAHKPKYTFYIPNYDWIRASHSIVNILSFGAPFSYPNLFNDDDRKVSDKMINILTHFAYYGSPPSQNGIIWPDFFSINGKVIAPYYEISSETKRDGNFGLNIKHVECDILWTPDTYS